MSEPLLAQLSRTLYPGWVILHVPHDSTDIPDWVRPQFRLNDEGLADELLRMTDHHTLQLFTGGRQMAQVVRANVSRLVVDVERFEDDSQEPMAGRGMGVIYTATSQGDPLRRPITDAEREELLHLHYHPHHAALTEAVDAVLDKYSLCLVLDCHSFPSVPLPCNEVQDPERTDICIGTDDFHTPDQVRQAFVREIEEAGFSIEVNTPFAGAMVPLKHYRTDRRVVAVMVEVNRKLYMDEKTGEKLPDFASAADRIRRCCLQALELCAVEWSS